MIKILEISNSTSKNGRKPIKIALYKIPTDNSEVNRNGIHWSNINTYNNNESVYGMPICAEFYDDVKRNPLGHGFLDGELILHWLELDIYLTRDIQTSFNGKRKSSFITSRYVYRDNE